MRLANTLSLLFYTSHPIAPSARTAPTLPFCPPRQLVFRPATRSRYIPGQTCLFPCYPTARGELAAHSAPFETRLELLTDRFALVQLYDTPNRTHHLPTSLIALLPYLHPPLPSRPFRRLLGAQNAGWNDLPVEVLQLIVDWGC